LTEQLSDRSKSDRLASSHHVDIADASAGISIAVRYFAADAIAQSVKQAIAT
jgi:hypothetical protein